MTGHWYRFCRASKSFTWLICLRCVLLLPRRCLFFFCQKLPGWEIFAKAAEKQRPRSIFSHFQCVTRIWPMFLEICTREALTIRWGSKEWVSTHSVTNEHVLSWFMVKWRDWWFHRILVKNLWGPAEVSRVDFLLFAWSFIRTSLTWLTCCRFDRSAVELVDQLLTLDPLKRLSAEKALEHSYFWRDPQIVSPSE